MNSPFVQIGLPTLIPSNMSPRSPVSMYCAEHTMKRCKHFAVVEVLPSAQRCVVDPMRLQRLTEALPNPKRQQPLVITAIGGQESRLALRQLFPLNDMKCREARSGFCNAYLDALTLKEDHPIIFLDIENGCGPAVHDARAHCHPFKNLPAGIEPQSTQFRSLFLRRVVFPFSDVVCIFSEDLGGLSGVMDQLLLWDKATLGAPREKLAVRLVIVVADDGQGVTRLEEIDFLARSREILFIRSLASITVHYSRRTTTDAIRYMPLRDAILRSELSLARNDRHERRSLYSCLHLADLFSQCLAEMVSMRWQPFDVFQASRRGIPQPPHLVECLEAILRAASQHSTPHPILASLLATALLMQAFPPDSHHFCPNYTFSTLYQQRLADAFARHIRGFDAADEGTAAHRTLRDQMVRYVHRQFSQGWEALCEAGASAAAFHQQHLREPTVRSQWSKHRSNLYCSICLFRRPEHVLRCRHAICESCVRIFGDARPLEDYSYVFLECVVCGRATHLLVRLKPPTAGLRIMSVDGGGVRGIVPLEFLAMLQKSLGTCCRLQDLFDFAIGTSAGGLVVLGLFAKQWDVREALTTFRSLAHRFFSSPFARRFPSLSRWHSYLRCAVRDSCYNSDVLNETLRETFDEHTRMFDYPELGVSQFKLAVVTTTISRVATKLLANYNGSKHVNADHGYRILRPDDNESEPLLWQAGRATSAAPGLFAPFPLPGLGTFQDGAMRHNNPINIALWESARIWPGTVRDVILSLGTGTTVSTTSPLSSTTKQNWNNKAIPRLCRSFLSSLDGESTWRDLLCHLGADSIGRFFRFNIEFRSSEPRLDDVSAMDQLSKEVALAYSSSSLRDLKFALLASCFYFEIRRPPKFDSSGYFACQGEIRVRGDPTKAFMGLRSIDDGPIEFWNNTAALGSIEPGLDTCKECARFRKKVCFFVRHPSELITISISLNGMRRNISGFPQSIAWFTEKQYLDTPFYSEESVTLSSLTCACQAQGEGRQEAMVKRRISSMHHTSRSSKRLKIETYVV